MSFKDHFSNHAEDYAKYRPSYPDELFMFILDHVSERNHAWDCATGNGQAALKLADHFNKITATDASSAQIESAKPHPRITYRVASAENSGLEEASADLITVAQALHWFNFDPFYEEVRRVAKEKCVLATWSYGLLEFGHDKIDEIIHDFYNNIVGPYWPPERKYTDEKYETIPFPFQKIKTPQFTMPIEYSGYHLINYLNTWSAVKNYQKERHADPLPGLQKKLLEYWPDQEIRMTARTTIYLNIGFVHL